MKTFDDIKREAITLSKTHTLNAILDHLHAKGLLMVWQPIELPIIEQNEDEKWLPVIGWERSYEVSNYGNVRNKNGILMGKWLNEHGYPLVRLTNLSNKQRKLYRVHRLVAEAFLPNPDKKPNVNHINCNREDNRVANLQWCTQKENVGHANKYGRMHRHGYPKPQWMDIETAPKDRLICIWIGDDKWGEPEMWSYCYYDNICKEWRTSRPSGHLRCVPERYVTHWMPLPVAPKGETK